MLIFCCACSSDNTEDGATDHDTYIVNGSVQKGQFIQGSTVTIQELDENLQPTGNNFQTQILDDMGTFKLSSEIKNRYVEIIANGYYFDEIAGKLSNGPLTLRAISDLSLEGVSNVNILTSLEAPRIKYLVLNERRTIPEARKIAEMEVLQSFNIPQNEFSAINGGFDKMDIARPGSNNAILLAISVTLQHKRTVAELSEIISKIAADIEVNGQLKDETLLSSIRNNGMEIDAKKVSSNLEKRYNELSILGYAIPDFEDYLDINGNGIIDKLDDWFITGQELDFLIDGATQKIEIPVSANFEYQIIMSQQAQEWITYISTRAMGMQSSTIVLNVKENETGSSRRADVQIQNKKGEIFQTICIEQIMHSGNITFADAEVRNILIEHHADTDNDGHISYLEAYAINSLGKWFQKTNVTSFDEFQYFVNVEQIVDEAFAICTGLTTITLPQSINKIGRAAFANCENLKAINIPQNVTTIEEGTFVNCLSLEDIHISENVTILSNEAFENCRSLTKIEIPNSITFVGDFVFSGCNALTAFQGKLATNDGKCLVINGELKSFAPYGLTTYNIPTYITSIGNSAFAYCRNLTNIVIPDNITSIGNSAFISCSNLTNIVIPKSVTTIGEGAFSDCISLSNVILPDYLTEIKDGTFQNCKKLTNITFPNNITLIGATAFSDCINIRQIYIPEKVRMIGNSAFYNCSNLNRIYCAPINPPIAGTSVWEFQALIGSRHIYVPTTSIDAYKGADGWTEYVDWITGYDF
jgi:hypothetical protein